MPRADHRTLELAALTAGLGTLSWDSPDALCLHDTAAAVLGAQPPADPSAHRDWLQRRLSAPDFAALVAAAGAVQDGSAARRTVTTTTPTPICWTLLQGGGAVIGTLQASPAAELAKLRRSEERLQALFAHAPVPIFIKDKDLRYLLVNQAEQRLLDRIAGRELSFDVVGRRHRDFDPEGGAFTEQRDAAVFESGQPSVFEDQFKDGDGRIQVSAAVTLFPIQTDAGEVTEMGGIALDITQRRLAEQALVETNQALERSNTLLRHFVYAVSHDLRAPLRTIRLLTELVQEDHGALLPEDGQHCLALVGSATQRMDTLLNDLRTFVELNVSVAPGTVDLSAVLADVRADLASHLSEAQATVHVTAPLPVVVGVESRLRQLLQNLLSNAIKYRSERPLQVTISVADEGERWRFSVRDNGIGVAPRFAERIFEAFARLHAHSQIEGSGLGLAVCRQILDQHGGAIWLDTDATPGATFHFTLPRRRVG